MQTDNELVHEVLDFDVQQLETSEACAEQLKLAVGEANKTAASAVGYGQMAIRYAIKAGEIMNKAKELVPHGEFEQWLLDCGVEASYQTCNRWMKMAKLSIVRDLMDNPNIKTITDAYRATGILPDPEPKAGGEEGDKVKPPFVLTFKTNYKHVTEWQPSDARDFLYEFDRIASLATQLRTEFGL
jgi:hypothetical protein